MRPLLLLGLLVLIAVPAASGSTPTGSGQLDNTRCAAAGDPSASVRLNCLPGFSKARETPIAVDPVDPNHVLVAWNELVFDEGTHAPARLPLAFAVSFDGGQTWTNGRLPTGGATFETDPAPAFDRKLATAHIAAVAGYCGLACGAVDVVVATSRDGGLSWHSVVVSHGAASTTPAAESVFNDKTELAADNYPSSPHYGRLYATWTKTLSQQGATVSSTTQLAYSDDGGSSWSTPTTINGASPTYCGGPCTLNAGPYPAVLPDGTLVVHFRNSQNVAASVGPGDVDDQLLVVRSTDGGATFSPPIHLVDLEDSSRDYPLNDFGEITLTGHQFATRADQGMTVDPSTGVLYDFFADNRDGVHDSDTPVTNVNVFLMRSTDGGLTWAGPLRVTSGPGDRWYPWAAARAGRLEVMFMDGSYDFPSRQRYGITLATSVDGGSTWSYQRVDSALSNPNDAFVGPNSCGNCETFIGDYNGLVIDSLGRTHIAWTDYSRTETAFGLTAAPGDAFYARR